MVFARHTSAHYWGYAMGNPADDCIELYAFDGRTHGGEASSCSHAHVKQRALSARQSRPPAAAACHRHHPLDRRPCRASVCRTYAQPLLNAPSLDVLSPPPACTAHTRHG